ncbi:uncharacterized protein PFL1_00491 [Pseudozyma flocculosa PF-1]|uniref:Related to Na+/H+-exchanging protein n=1 Tax=Pseudozyma flocculosa TaxID=84751 RepID=A0A5C3ESB9_9BASI|nr:uncharacterized protein PFL1_00491 [Pseudozyma flocculosa PF-1]EPQ32294.1 hypothetical protein PFL1_00491 [Pseudozyma flocculosa PF-1]SPO34750.1 related to Na+/H+-exchanging protein [Pseudozyma flocculosa]
MPIELQWTPVNFLAAGFGLVFILFGSVSYLVKERLFLGEAPIAVLVGIALGPYGLAGFTDWFPRDGMHDKIGLAMSRIIIGIQLAMVGIQVQLHYRSLAVLLVPVMTLMWLATTLCIYLALPDLPLLAALVVGVGPSPTDPVLSAALVQGAFADQHVSPRIRNLVSAESGANDGFAYPLLYLAVNLLKYTTTSEALKAWLLETCLYTVAGSVAYGCLVGYACRKLLEFSTRKDWIDKESFLLYGAAMAVFLVGSGGLFEFDDLLAAFVAGNALSWNDFYREQCDESEVDNCLDLVLNMVFFAFLGATIPWDAFNAPEYGITPARLVVMCIAVLVLRRLPAMLALWRLVPTIHDVSEAAFVGYFAPIGAGAFFYMEHTIQELSEDGDDYATRRILEVVKPVTYALILSSLIGHTFCIPLVKLYFDYRGIGTIKLDGDSSSLRGSESGSSSAYDEEEAGEEVPGRDEETAVVDDDDDGDDGQGSFQQSTSHRPRSESATTTSDAARGQGAYRSDGTWDQHASWRHSSGHKVGHVHHRRRRDESRSKRPDQPAAATTTTAAAAARATSGSSDDRAVEVQRQEEGRAGM